MGSSKSKKKDCDHNWIRIDDFRTNGDYYLLVFCNKCLKIRKVNIMEELKLEKEKEEAKKKMPDKDKKDLVIK